MKYFFHILSKEKFHIDSSGQSFGDVENMKDHALMMAKDLSAKGLQGYALVVTKEGGDIVQRINIDT